MMATTAAPTAALAHDRGKHHWHKKHDRGHYRDRGYDRDRGYYRDAGYYRGDRRYSGYRCKRDNGTGGLVIGAIAGGLLGNEIARDKTAGTIIGGGVGALAGRPNDKRSEERRVGKGVSVGADLGGPRTITKKKK